MEHITLCYRQGSSDKIYQASLETRDGNYVVTFSYGRRAARSALAPKPRRP